MRSFAPIRRFLLPKLLLGFFSVRLAFAEVSVWKNNATEFRGDGSCWMLHASKGALSPKTSYGNASSNGLQCGDPKYEQMRQCQMANFYRDEKPEDSDVYKTENGGILFLIDGCVQCPYGRAEVTIQLINNFPSGSWFSGCDEKRVVASSVTVLVNSLSSRDGVEMDGTFSLGGVLQERDCGGFLGIGSAREDIIQFLMLELSHNCGRQRSMLLKVKLPKVDIPSLKARGKMAELRGISVDLGISGAGWNERLVEFGMVRPKQFVPQRPLREEGTFGGRPQATETHQQALPRVEQRGESKDTEAKVAANPVQAASAAGKGRPNPSEENGTGSFPSPTLLQIAVIAAFFCFVILFGFCVRCLLQRRRRRRRHR